MFKLRADGREFVEVQVEIRNAGVVIDPHTYTVEFAFPLQFVEPISGDWHPGSWEQGVDKANNLAWYSRILVGGIGSGQGAVELDTTKVYDVHWRVTANPEQIPRKITLLRFD